MDGFQFIDAFKKLDFPKKEKILIVVLTSSINPNDLQKVKSMGIDHYMTKPVSEEKVLALIQD
jgi:CheY-like chemotaxis protein